MKYSKINKIINQIHNKEQENKHINQQDKIFLIQKMVKNWRQKMQKDMEIFIIQIKDN